MMFDGAWHESKVRILATTGMVLGFGLFLYLYTESDVEVASGLVGRQLPAMELPMVDDAPLNTADFTAGSATVLVFFVTHSKFSALTLRKVQAFHEWSESRPVAVRLVNVGESEAIVRGFLEHNDLALPVALDPNGALTQAVGVDSTPFALGLSPGGRVVYADNFLPYKHEWPDFVMTLAAEGYAAQ